MFWLCFACWILATKETYMQRHFPGSRTSAIAITGQAVCRSGSSAHPVEEQAGGSNLMHKLVIKGLKLIANGMVLALSLPTIAQASDFKIVGNVDEISQIQQSLAACQSLDDKLDRLEKSGKFHRIRVTTEDETKQKGPFLAAVSGKDIIITADWLAQQSKPYFDVRYNGEMLPDNLCFALGHLSDHLENPISPPRAIDFQIGLEEQAKAWLEERLKAESRAYLRAWPFVLEAALVKNGRPLDIRQSTHLVLNLRYRFAFFEAMDPKANPRLFLSAEGNIPETDANVASIALILSRSTIADLE
jgi:hypothetical protein